MDQPSWAAELVDMRNIGVHKSLKLTVHIPAERAEAFIADFGWATMVDPKWIKITKLDPDDDGNVTK